MSSLKLAEEYGVRQKTIWEFKRKMQLALHSKDIDFLNGTVLVSDVCIMEHDKGHYENIILVAIEVLDNGEVGKAYGVMLDRLSPEHIQRFFEQHISTNAKVYVSKERDYELLTIKYNMEINEDTYLLTQSFTHITNLRNWLFGVHRHVLPKYIQGYLNEYYFRFNRRNNKTMLFDEFIGLMMQKQPNRTYMKQRHTNMYVL